MKKECNSNSNNSLNKEAFHAITINGTDNSSSSGEETNVNENESINIEINVDDEEESPMKRMKKAGSHHDSSHHDSDGFHGDADEESNAGNDSDHSDNSPVKTFQQQPPTFDAR
jgi:hypothetical protein